MSKLSVCIPTYNRASHLKNCLQSIISIQSKSNFDFQICISDNCSTDETEKVVLWAKKQMPIKYKKNNCNIGMTRNFLSVVEMADNEFVWMIGDDDLVLPHAFSRISSLLDKNTSVDYFYINSNHLTTEYVFSYPQPFNLSNVPEEMRPFSTFNFNGELDFLELINPKISFDFLGGIFLSIFRRQSWIENVDVLDKKALSDARTFSHFDNTFPHIKIFSKAFANSRAYFYKEPLSICLTGAREWSPMYPLVHSVRLIESLDEYKKNGLPYLQYLRCKNFALNNFIPELVYIILNKSHSGFKYINPYKLVIKNCFFPNFYFSLINLFIRKSKLILISIFK